MGRKIAPVYEKLRRDAGDLEGQINSTVSLLKVLETDIDRHKLRAPVDGRVGDVVTLPIGSVLHEGEQLGVVVPEERIEGRCRFFARSTGAGARGASGPASNSTPFCFRFFFFRFFFFFFFFFFWFSLVLLGTAGCHSSDTAAEEAVRNAKKALVGYLEALQKNGESIPEGDHPGRGIARRFTVNLPAPVSSTACPRAQRP